jgi:hypothetical protein
MAVEMSFFPAIQFSAALLSVWPQASELLNGQRFSAANSVGELDTNWNTDLQVK